MSAIYFGIDFGRITTGGIVTGFPLPNFCGSIYCITTGTDGNVWFTQPQANQIGRITPSGAVTEFLLPNFKTYPYGITAGPDGNLWFTEFYGNRIGRITTSGVITEFPLTIKGPTLAITAGADGNLWFPQEDLEPHTESGIGEITIDWRLM